MLVFFSANTTESLGIYAAVLAIDIFMEEI